MVGSAHIAGEAANASLHRLTAVTKERLEKAIREFRDRFRVGGSVRSRHNDARRRLERDQVLRSRRQRRRAEFRVRGRWAGVDAGQRLEGGPVVARLDQRPAQVEMGRREPGFKPDGLAEFGDGLVEAPLPSSA